MGSSDRQVRFISMKDALLQVLAEALTSRCGVEAGEPLIVAVSGGSDSMALLHGLARLPGLPVRRLVVAHVNHGLRSNESDADEQFVRQACSDLEVEFRAKRVEVTRPTRPNGESLEMTCRRLRHGALAQVCREVGIRRVCLAHTADDQVEHFFLRLFRGAGSAGLRGMGWVSPSPVDPQVELIRPLLGATRTQLRALLQRFGSGFREDSSNNDLSIPRNRIRHELVPLLRRVAGPSVDDLIRRSMELVGAEGALVESLASSWLEQSTKEPFESQPIAIQRIALRTQLIAMGVQPEFRIIEKLRQPGTQQVAVAGGRWVAKAASGSLLPLPAFADSVPSAAPIPFQSGWVIPTEASGYLDLPGPSRILWCRLDPVPEKLPQPEVETLFDAGSLDGGFFFRHWRPGDFIRCLGMKGRTKLQDLFVNRKLPRAKRHEVWIGEDRRGEVFWIEGFPPSENHKIRSGSTGVIGIRCIRGAQQCLHVAPLAVR
jgi:tRNA(Ile)-lysidine synthase